MKIKVGNILTLRRSKFQDELRDISASVEAWSEKYLYEDRFKYVYLRYPQLEAKTGAIGDAAITLFGSTQDIITDIKTDSDGKIQEIRSNLFTVFYPYAEKEKEIIITSFVEAYYTVPKIEKDVIEMIDGIEFEYHNGLFEVFQRENNKMDFYRFGFNKMIQEKKWLNVYLKRLARGACAQVSYFKYYWDGGNNSSGGEPAGYQRIWDLFMPSSQRNAAKITLKFNRLFVKEWERIVPLMPTRFFEEYSIHEAYMFLKEIFPEILEDLLAGKPKYKHLELPPKERRNKF